MKLFKYWAKAEGDFDVDGRTFHLSCFRGSHTGVEDARRNAQSHLSKIADRFRTGQEWDSYTYQDRPLREPIVEEFTHDGKVVAAITRNAYGALVLNSQNVLFADIDRPRREPGSSIGARVLAWFGKKRTAPTFDEAVRENVAAVSSDYNGLKIRLYETCAGYRCLVNSRLFNPSSSESQTLLQRLSSDPLYVKLCKTHDCYRARLTPKPWRCGLGEPPSRFPFETPQLAQEFESWLREYENRIQAFATCRFVQEIGSQSETEPADAVVQLHDRFCSDSPAGGIHEKPLA